MTKQKTYKKYKGGFTYGINNANNALYTPNEAITFFLNNLKESKILTDSSISCITLLLTINDGINDKHHPYLINRRTEFNKPIKKILLKLFISSDTDGNTVFNDRFMETTSNAKLVNEANTQLDIYRKSFISNENVFDPICPAILNCKTKLTDVEKAYLKTKILKCFVNRDNKPTGVCDTMLLHEYFKYNISFICMEYLSGYNILHDFRSDPRFPNFIKLTVFELLKLYDYGYIHHDFHMGNIMINPDYMYLTDDSTKTDLLGRAIIIDFGRTGLHNQTFIDEITKLQYIRDNEAQLSGWGVDFSDKKIPNMVKELEKLIPLRNEMNAKFLENIISLFPSLTTDDINQKIIAIANNPIMLDVPTNSKTGGKYEYKEIGNKFLKSTEKNADKFNEINKEKDMNKLNEIINNSLKPYSLLNDNTLSKGNLLNKKKSSNKKSFTKTIKKQTRKRSNLLTI
jgi:hypothetical protein